MRLRARAVGVGGGRGSPCFESLAMVGWRLKTTSWCSFFIWHHFLFLKITSPILRDWSISGALRGVSIQIDICIVVITNKIDFWFNVFFVGEKAYIRLGWGEISYFLFQVLECSANFDEVIQL